MDPVTDVGAPTDAARSVATVDPGAYVPVGLLARPWRRTDDGGSDPRDVASMLALMDAAELAVLGECDSSVDEVEEMFTGPATDHEASLLVEDGEVAVGFAWIENDTTMAESWIDAYVQPGHGDLLDGLLAYSVAVAAGHRAGVPDAAEWALRSGCFAADASQCQALERAGFHRVRRYWRMRIDLTGTQASPGGPVQPPPLPTGVEIIDASAEPLRRTAYELETTAFEDMWNHVTREYDDWFGFFDLPYLDPAGWWVLTVDGVPAAVCILDDSRRDIGEGYVRSLGVLREYRGRGLARLLLERAFDYYRGRGMVGVQLGVDSASPTGANHLYEKVGMTPHRVIDAWSRPID